MNYQSTELIYHIHRTYRTMRHKLLSKFLYVNIWRRMNPFELIVALNRSVSASSDWEGSASGSLYLDDSISQGSMHIVEWFLTCENYTYSNFYKLQIKNRYKLQMKLKDEKYRLNTSTEQIIDHHNINLSTLISTHTQIQLLCRFNYFGKILVHPLHRY